ncbi:MAG: AbrB/MazE/SpoVT family DNA-binding domain-containing protein [Bifidobacteriaceae bacterium]|jgi:AbrB family looped-hinge helix DNA binding protein|nr:AbrB/MazE/SpoVT family DNA-binding domain-containing protein [Bifidobacteriaceae bacterium]
MKATIDSGGRVLIPKALRSATGLEAGCEVDISAHGGGLQVIPGGRSASLVEERGRLVIAGTTAVTDAVIYALAEAGRK